MIITPVESFENLSEALKIYLYIKRDDLCLFPGGGSKVRKLSYIIKKAQEMNCNSIVTAGGLQSNHIRVAAMMCARLKWKSIMIIHDEKPNRSYTGNLKITSLTGSEMRFVKKNEVKGAMEEAMVNLQSRGFNPFYIYGGGHCLEGSLAFYEAAKELKFQLKSIMPDFIVVASGTGTTQAGLEVGVRQVFPYCRVLGVSVARNEKRGKAIILESMKELNNYLNNQIELSTDIFFDDRWVGDGYESTYPELLETIRWAARTEGLILDPTYTGKAFYALKKYVESGTIQKYSKVVFWHTGGLLNLMASNKI